MTPQPERSTLTETPRLAMVAQPSPDASAELVPASSSAELKAQSEYLWNIHKYKNDYIRFADTKSAFTVTFCSALLAALFKSGIHQRFLTAAPRDWLLLAWMALASFFCLAAAVGFGVWTIRPRLASQQPKGLIYWGGIAEHGSEEAFWNSLKGRTPEQLVEHLAHHVFKLSTVAKQKYFWVSMSMTTAAIGGAFAALTFLFR